MQNTVTSSWAHFSGRNFWENYTFSYKILKSIQLGLTYWQRLRSPMCSELRFLTYVCYKRQILDTSNCTNLLNCIDFLLDFIFPLSQQTLKRGNAALTVSITFR